MVHKQVVFDAASVMQRDALDIIPLQYTVYARFPQYSSDGVRQVYAEPRRVRRVYEAITSLSAEEEIDLLPNIVLYK